MSRRAPSHQRRVMILPRIPVKPDRNASVVTAIPYQPRSPMGWCEYLKEVGIESPKCGERGAKVAGKGDNVTQKKRGKKRRKKKERIVVEWERTMEQDELEEEKRQKQLLMVTEEVQRRLQEEEEREQYRIEGTLFTPSWIYLFWHTQQVSATFLRAKGTLSAVARLANAPRAHSVAVESATHDVADGTPMPNARARTSSATAVFRKTQ
ncbi:hypothetical protein GPALN_013035 [Globodera pallida]|nr:hypothetical protein GPALN_013035 [Globodera pallida]